MVQGQTIGEPTIRAKSSSDIYTVLLIVATLFVAIGFGYMIWRNHVLFGTWFPTVGT